MLENAVEYWKNKTNSNIGRKRVAFREERQREGERKHSLWKTDGLEVDCYVILF